MMNPNMNQMNMMNPNMNQINWPLNFQTNPNNYNMNLKSPNNNNFILNPKLNELINKILNFYYSNNNYNMNFNNPIQINSLLNNLNTKYPGLHQSDYKKYLFKMDPLPYMKEEKMVIKFINSDYDIINVKIPKDITKSDFYSIDKLYKVFYSSILY